MFQINKAFLLGNLTRDPEVKTTQSGIAVCTFTIAVERRFNGQGEKQTDFIPIVAWRKLAELCGRYLQKGRPVAVVGSIQTRSYDANDGSKRYITEIIADEIKFLNPGKQQDQQDQATPQGEPGPIDLDGFEDVTGTEEVPF